MSNNILKKVMMGNAAGWMHHGSEIVAAISSMENVTKAEFQGMMLRFVSDVLMAVTDERAEQLKQFEKCDQQGCECHLSSNKIGELICQIREEYKKEVENMDKQQGEGGFAE